MTQPAMTQSPRTLAEIAEALGATVEGDGSLTVRRAVHPSEAEGPEDLALAMDKDLLALLSGSKAVAAVVAERSESDLDP